MGAYPDVMLAAVAIVATTWLTVRGLRKRRNGREWCPRSDSSGWRAELWVFTIRIRIRAEEVAAA